MLKYFNINIIWAYDYVVCSYFKAIYQLIILLFREFGLTILLTSESRWQMAENIFSKHVLLNGGSNY